MVPVRSNAGNHAKFSTIPVVYWAGTTGTSTSPFIHTTQPCTIKPAKQRQATGQIRTGTSEINNTTQASSQHHLPGKSTTRAKVKLTTIPFN